MWPEKEKGQMKMKHEKLCHNTLDLFLRGPRKHLAYKCTKKPYKCLNSQFGFSDSLSG